MAKHHSVKDFISKQDKGTEESANGADTTIDTAGGASEDLLEQSRGGDSSGAGESSNTSTGIGGEQTDTSNDASGLSDAETDADSEDTTIGAGSTTGKSGDKKGGAAKA